jgi:excisionase family DNA binding protein
MSQSEFMTVGEAAAYLGVSKPKMTRLIHAGMLPTLENKLDLRSKLVRRADVEALKRQGRPSEAPSKSAAGSSPRRR